MESNNSKPSISIIGMGFVGLVSAVCFANRGFKVIATSLESDVVDKVNKGIAPFYEKNLEELLIKARELNNLIASLDNNQAINESEISFISVGTPKLEDNSIDLSYINNCSVEIGKALKNKEKYHLIVARSTIVPGTTRNLIGKNIEEYSGKKLGRDFGLCMQPEFLAEGRSIEDTFNPDRIIIGEIDNKSGNILQDFYENFYGEHLKKCPIMRMNLESAELVKYGNNCLLSTKISFANEFANFAELIPNIDIVQVMKGVGLDYRINHRFLGAGVGFGGSCFHKDVSAIKSWAKSNGYTSRLLEAVLNINDDQAIHIVDIAEQLAGKLEGKRVTLLGLSFKPGTDDMREAASVRVVNELLKRGVKNIVGYDPKANKMAEIEMGKKIEYANSIEEALNESECAFLITEWDEFKTLTPDNFKQLMKTPNVIDGRRIYDYDTFNAALPFRAIGRINLK